MISRENTLVLDEQANRFRALDNWFTTPQGSRVALSFADEIAQVNEQMSGRTLLQLGSCGDNRWLLSLKFRNKWLVNPTVILQKTSMVTSLTMLPVERDSVDCVIAPLTMEAFSQGKNPIDEIDRVLKPMGYVIFFGINPFSFWGAALRSGYLSCFGDIPVTLTSSLTVKSMMLNRGYRQCAFSSFYYIPPVTSSGWIKKLEFLNEMGKMVWPFPAGFYCYIAQKHQHCYPSLLLDERQKERLMQQKLPLQVTIRAPHE